MGLAFLNVFTLGIPVAFSIGLTLYGTIIILKQKSIITDKSIRTLKITSNLFSYVGLALLVLSVTLLIIFSLLMHIFSITMMILLILSFIILCAGVSIPYKVKKESANS
jgi:hypothetical protein